MKESQSQTTITLNADVVNKVMTDLENERESLIRYLQMKVNTQDWHGVADAAMDLRDVDSALKTIKDLQIFRWSTTV